MKNRDYCCCAIPLVMVGIYTVLLEQFVLALVVGILSIATPSIVGAAVYSFSSWVLAILCFVAAGVQLLGFLAVRQEKTTMYRRYVTLHSLISTAAFSVALAWIIVSATRHSTAQTNCLNNFFAIDTTNQAGVIMCDIFPWVDVGIMGALWIFLASTQLYFYLIVNNYGHAARNLESKFDSVYDNLASKPLNGGIPVNERPDEAAWSGNVDNSGYGHRRNDSGASVSTVLGSQNQRATDNYSGGYVGSGYETSYPPAPARKSTYETPVPSNAYSHQEPPTPDYRQDSYDQYGVSAPGVDRPGRTQAHPAEGSFRRKMPRTQPYYE